MRQAVILAAGKGTRLRPYTENIPKPLVEINGKPFIHYIFRNLEKAGFEKVVMVIEYLKEKIVDYIDTHDFPFDVVLIEQGEPLGTGHAVKVAEDAVEGNFLVINGDDLFSAEDMRSIDTDDEYSYLIGEENPQPQNYGVLEVEGDMLVNILEKPEEPPTNLISAGMYKFTPEIFSILETIKRSPRGEFELPDAMKKLIRKKKMKVSRVKGYHYTLSEPKDIPVLESFLKEELD